MQIEQYDGTEDVFNLGSGDSYIIHNFFTKDKADSLFTRLTDDTKWGSFSIRNSAVPRLVSVQGDTDNDNNPVYRHPIDEHPPLENWSEPSKEIKDKIEDRIGSKYNHALVQLYRDGRDFISPHSDKTLDIRHNTNIVNVSLGSTRILVLKSKDKTKKQEIKLPHGSVYVLGWKTNMEWLHSIKRNGDPSVVVKPRISLTFRDIATFKTETIVGNVCLYGQGAKCKTIDQLIWRNVFEWLTWMIFFSSPLLLIHLGYPMTVLITFMIAFTLKIMWTTKRKKDDALGMFRLFSRMNKETDPEVFMPKEGYDAITYSEYI